MYAATTRRHDYLNTYVADLANVIDMDAIGGVEIPMAPSSPYAMQRLIGLKDRFEIAFACDTDYDRHGIVTKSAGLLPHNHYLSVAIHYLFQHRPLWGTGGAVGKTAVSSQMIASPPSSAESSTR